MVLKGGIGTLLLLFLITFFLVKPVFASTTDGTISDGYVWSEKIGWINFKATNGNVRITDTALIGDAWSDLYGWITLNPANGGVINNSEGVLSGTAWGTNIGWIDFSGVTINSEGIFSGTANGVNTGVVNFSCTNCLVQTDWRPASNRASNEGGGHTILPIPNPVVTPTQPTTSSTTTTPTPITTSSTPPIKTPISTKPTSTGGKIIEGVTDTTTEPVPTMSSSTEVPVSAFAQLYAKAKLWLPKFFLLNPGGADGVGTNMSLTPEFWWSKSLFWKTTLLVLVIILLLFKFYKYWKINKK